MLKKKIEKPLTAEQLKEKVQQASKTGKVVFPSYETLLNTEKKKSTEIKEGSFSHIEISGVAFYEEMGGVDLRGEQHILIPGGMRICFNWAVPGFGFGEMTIRKTGEKYFIDSEMLGKDFVKAMLCDLVEKAEVK